MKKIATSKTISRPKRQEPEFWKRKKNNHNLSSLSIKLPKGKIVSPTLPSRLPKKK